MHFGRFSGPMILPKYVDRIDLNESWKGLNDRSNNVRRVLIASTRSL